MQARKTPAVSVDLEHRSSARTAAKLRRPIQSVARQNQSGKRQSSVAAVNKTMQGRKTRAIGVDREHRAIDRTAALLCHPIQSAARYNQSGLRPSCGAVGILTA